MQSIVQRVFIAIVFILSASQAGAQGWSAIASGTAKTLRGVFSASSSLTIACGNDGTVIGTSNGGASWTAGNTGTTEHLNKVFVSGLTLPVIAVVGDNGTMLYSSNVGITWNTWTSGTTEDLNDLFVHDPTVGTTMTAVGDNGVILFTNNAGTIWNLKLSPTPDRLNGVFFRDLLNGVIVGNNGLILRTSNGGASWATVTSPVATDLNHVFFTGADDGCIVGNAGVIMRTTDGGGSWTPVTSPVTADLERLMFSDPSNGTAVGSAGTIIRTTDAGATWTMQVSGTAEDLHAVFFVDANNGMAVGSNGTALKTTNGGVPVELRSFSAAALDNGAVLLRWSTATESGNYGFEVERHEDGSWSTLGFVPGHGDSRALRRYTFTDQSPGDGLLRYRLRQIDYDGSAAYSPVITLASGIRPAAFSIEAFPNPAQTGAQVGVTLPQAGALRVLAYDASGRTAATLLDAERTAGTHLLMWDTSGLPAGVYHLVARTTDGSTVTRIIVR